MAATSHPLATATALGVLRDGGNAVDAAIAAVAVLGVVEPTQTGIGGDCFALYMPAATGRVHAINGSGWAPAAASTDWFRDRGIPAIDPTSAHAVTVPGAVAAWGRLAEDHGTFGLDRLLAPAIRAAEDGYPVTERVARDWRRQLTKLRSQPHAAATFLPGGEAPRAGDLHRQPRLAAALRAIASGGPAAFYRGEIAADIVACLRALGGLHSLDDFAAFEAEYVEPIRASYRGYDLWQCPPNGQGLTSLLIARTLERFEIGRLAALGAERLHLLGEAARLGYAVRDAVVCDPRQGRVKVEELLSDRHVATLASRISPSQRIADLTPAPLPAHRDTVFLTVVDRDLNCIAFINSIFDDFGSGIVAPQTGIVLHNRGSGFVIDPAHPNTIAGRKRPLHTIIPALLTRAGRAVMPFGCTGGHFQPIGQMQLLSNLLDLGMPLQRAVDAPRIFARGEVFEVERRIPADAVAGLRALGHVVTLAENPLGTAQAIYIDRERGILHGAADGRRDGVALGW
ncbi:MAG: gamma-glutamyltransferase [Proteobacteria bacterium]|nr:gamma-glutamyltransferase [Pseudomonadota bacterium]